MLKYGIQSDYPMDITTKTILVVDDSSALRVKLCDYLQKEGYATVPASDGAEAIKQLKLIPDVDLVLLDVEMPIINGFEVIRMMRAGGIAPDTPVLALTGAVKNPKVIHGLKEAGATGYVSKDVDLSEIRRRIDKLLYPEKED